MALRRCYLEKHGCISVQQVFQVLLDCCGVWEVILLLT